MRKATPAEEDLVATETAEEQRVTDSERAEADGVADPKSVSTESSELRHHCRDHTTRDACNVCPYDCDWIQIVENFWGCVGWL